MVFDRDLYLYKGPKISRDVLSIMAVSLNTRNSIMSQAYRPIHAGIVHNTSYTQWVAAQLAYLFYREMHFSECSCIGKHYKISARDK